MFLAPLLSIVQMWSAVYTKFLFCYLVSVTISLVHFHVLQFHALLLGPSFSRPAFSAPPVIYMYNAKRLKCVYCHSSIQYDTRQTADVCIAYRCRSLSITNDSVELFMNMNRRDDCLFPYSRTWAVHMWCNVCTEASKLITRWTCHVWRVHFLT